MSTDNPYAPRHATKDRIFMSPPDMSSAERDALIEAFDSNWIAPVGPALDGLEDRLCQLTTREAAVALTSGTSALHLGLLVLGVGPGDTVIVPSLTFVASANVVRYLGAEPVFVDCDPGTANMDPHLLEAALRGLANSHRLPAAVMTVDLYGSCANYTSIEGICATYGVPILEDAAEAIGARHGFSPAGSFGTLSAFSFNGNKLITSGGGGALVGPDHLITKARYLASQARSNDLHFEHHEVGYAYRLSNLLAAVASAQLDRIDDMIDRTRAINTRYREILSLIPGADLINIDREGHGNGWLSVVQFDQERYGSIQSICEAMARDGIEARPAWKPMHLQPLYRNAMMIGGEAAEAHFASGMCLPSGSSMSSVQQERVISCLLTALSSTTHSDSDPLTIQLPNDLPAEHSAWPSVIQLPEDRPAHAALGQAVLGRATQGQPAHASEAMPTHSFVESAAHAAGPAQSTAADLSSRAARVTAGSIQLPAPIPVPPTRPLDPPTPARVTAEAQAQAQAKARAIFGAQAKAITPDTAAYPDAIQQADAIQQPDAIQLPAPTPIPTQPIDLNPTPIPTQPIDLNPAQSVIDLDEKPQESVDIRTEAAQDTTRP